MMSLMTRQHGEEVEQTSSISNVDVHEQGKAFAISKDWKPPRQLWDICAADKLKFVH